MQASRLVFARILSAAVVATGLLWLPACGIGQDASDSPVQTALAPIPLEADLVDDLPLQARIGGKIALINVWATWCAPCRRELPSLETLYRHADPDRIAVLGVALDEDAMIVREYLRDVGVTYGNLRDPGGHLVRQQWGITTVPATLIVGRDGQVIARIDGERRWNEGRWLAGLEAAYSDPTSWYNVADLR